MKKYNVIYADPPWTYQKNGQGCAKNHYPTMPLHEIMALPVQQLAAEDCALFLWATYPMLPEALQVLEAWGFKYRTVAFTWVKRNRNKQTWFIGLGFWTRANAEICLLAKKGHPKRVSNLVSQIIDSPLERHSKKPDEARRRIEQLMGDVPRVELFAREATSGWDVWGNEVKNDFEM